MIIRAVPLGKVSLSIIAIFVCAFVLSVLISNEALSSVYSSSIFSSRAGGKEGEETDEDYVFEFDPDICDITEGKWVYNSTMKPLYTDRSCPYLDRQVSCTKNGRPDSDYRYWHWQPEECTLPRFNPKMALKKLRGKKLMFVGDSLIRGQWQSFVCLIEFVSLIRGQWQSFVCLIESVIPDSQKSL